MLGRLFHLSTLMLVVLTFAIGVYTSCAACSFLPSQKDRLRLEFVFSSCPRTNTGGSRSPRSPLQSGQSGQPENTNHCREITASPPASCCSATRQSKEMTSAKTVSAREASCRCALLWRKSPARFLPLSP